MKPNKLPVGSFVRIEKSELQAILDSLQQREFRTIGPTVRDGAIVLDDLASLDQLPMGYLDVQDGGSYRLETDETSGYFDYVVGPESLKRFLFPPHTVVLEGHRENGKWVMATKRDQTRPLAIIGARSCDLHALELQDRVFLKNSFVDPTYQARREDLFVLAVNCRRAAATCFCHSMKTGPACKSGFDLALTEFDDSFVLEVGTLRGGELATVTNWTPCSLERVHEAQGVPEHLARTMKQRPTKSRPGRGQPRGRHLNTTDIHDLLVDNLQHPRWDEVARRCLACGNCTLVCPTCFCSSLEERDGFDGRSSEPRADVGFVFHRRSFLHEFRHGAARRSHHAIGNG